MPIPRRVEIKKIISQKVIYTENQPIIDSVIRHGRGNQSEAWFKWLSNISV